MIRKQVHIKSAQDKALKRLARRTHRQDLFPEAGVGGGKTSMSVHPGKAAKAPIDTNVLAYAYDRSEPVKQKQKLNVLGELSALHDPAVRAGAVRPGAPIHGGISRSIARRTGGH